MAARLPRPSLIGIVEERIVRARKKLLTHYSLSRYSPGTSSSGTSCVRTSFSSAFPASSTPVTTSASNAFPSSINSPTLSESARPTRDNPCKSPDCWPERAPALSCENAPILEPIVLLPTAFDFTAAFFSDPFFFANSLLGAALFMASFFLAVFFIGLTSLPAILFDFVCFFLVFFLAAIGEVYHRHMCATKRPVV